MPAKRCCIVLVGIVLSAQCQAFVEQIRRRKKSAGWCSTACSSRLGMIVEVPSSLVKEDSPTQLEPKKEKNEMWPLNSPKVTPPWTPLCFLLQSLNGRHHRYMHHLMLTHGDNFFISKNHVVLHDVHAIRDVLEVHNLEKAEQVRRGFSTLVGARGGILAAPWKRWVEERRMTAPALGQAVIRELAPIFRQGAQPMLQLVHSAASANTTVEMDQVFTALTLDTIGMVLAGKSFGMGERLLAGDFSEFSFSRAVREVSNESIRQMILPRNMLRRFPPGNEVTKARGIIDCVLDDWIAQRMKEQMTGSPKISDLLSILLEAEGRGVISRKDVKSQLFLFLFAGHDTTAHTLTWLLYEVSMNVELQESLHREAATVLPTLNSFIMNPEILQNQLPLLDAVWKETNRLHPAAATGTTRRVGSQPIVVGRGLELPAKAIISIPPYSLHRNEKYWPNPQDFDPSRFLNIEKQSNPMAFQAFSAGPRTCIGAKLARAEALSVTSALFRRFRVRCVERVHPPEEFMSLTLRPKHGIRFQFELRNE
jgi:cytochrome P450